MVTWLSSNKPGNRLENRSLSENYGLAVTELYARKTSKTHIITIKIVRIKEKNMDIEVISKLAFGIVSSLGTIALILFNMGQARKIKAELLDKFEEAVARESIHSVTELFRLIHGLRMSYVDIIELIRHDQCSKIIYALKKTPGMVYYENGEFRYTRMARNGLFRFFDRWFLRLSISLFSILGLFSLGMLGFGNGATSVAGFIFLLFCSVMLAVQLRQRAYDQMVQRLIEPGRNNQMQPTANASTD